MSDLKKAADVPVGFRSSHDLSHENLKSRKAMGWEGSTETVQKLGTADRRERAKIRRARLQGPGISLYRPRPAAWVRMGNREAGYSMG